jgi:acetyl esterase/lipase
MIKNIEYGSVVGEQKLDIYLPTDVEGLHPVVLLIHEGNGRKEQLTAWGKSLAKQGYAAVSINYRGWPNYVYPQNVSDAFCALAWIHANAAEYRFDTEYVFVLGHSSGGTLAALVGVIDDPGTYLKTCQHELPASNWVQGVITFTGIFDYASASQYSSGLKSYAEALLGGSQETKIDNWEQASAVTWIDGSEPPFLVFHGGNDHNIPPEQSMDFAKTRQIRRSKKDKKLRAGSCPAWIIFGIICGSDCQF